MTPMGKRLHPPDDSPARQTFVEAFTVAQLALIRTGIPRRNVKAEVAKRLGVSRRSVYRWLDGRVMPPLDAARELRALDKTLDPLSDDVLCSL